MEQVHGTSMGPVRFVSGKWNGPALEPKTCPAGEPFCPAAPRDTPGGSAPGAVFVLVLFLAGLTSSPQ